MERPFQPGAFICSRVDAVDMLGHPHHCVERVKARAPTLLDVPSVTKRLQWTTWIRQASRDDNIPTRTTATLNKSLEDAPSNDAVVQSVETRSLDYDRLRSFPSRTKLCTPSRNRRLHKYKEGQYVRSYALPTCLC